MDFANTHAASAAELPNEQLESLKGAVQAILFHNADSGFCVLTVQVPGRPDLVTVVGLAPQVNLEEQVEAQGQWVTDKRFGLQFKASDLRIVPPSSLEGIERYLGSGLIKGLGPSMAARLIAAFGEQVLEVIEQEPERLKEVSGIGKKRVEQITSSWAEQQMVREIMVFLQSHGIGTARAVRIYKTYGQNAIAKVRENPYRLAIDIHGIGFRIADQLAIQLGIPRDSPLRARAGVHHVLQEATSYGHCAIWYDELVTRSIKLLGIRRELVTAAIEHAVSTEIAIAERVGEQTLLFPSNLYRAECRVADNLKRLAEGAPHWSSIEEDSALEWVENQTGLRLAASQRSAVAQVINGKVTVITGGPGVGKTTVVNSILKILQLHRVKATLCAPTGRAAKRLSESTGEEAKTIHRLLGFDPTTMDFQRNAADPLDTELLVCDETSMVDVRLMHKLLEAIPSHASVLLVGDVDQLPSVGPGAVLADTINSGAVPTVRLTEIFRQAKTSQIIVNAHKINAGEVPEPPNPQPLDSDWFLIRCSSPEMIQERLLHTVSERIPQRFGFDPVRDVQVLTPMHRGELGTRTLNTLLQERLNPSAEPRIERFGSTYSPGDKVIQLVNNYDKEVFNGDIGWILGIDLDEKQVRVGYENRHVLYAFDELDELALAYATSVHKSQGSEYPVVVMPLAMQHYMLLQRNLLYTGVTRGKQLVVLLAEPKALNMAIKNTGGGRLTRLNERLLSCCHR